MSKQRTKTVLITLAAVLALVATACSGTADDTLVLAVNVNQEAEVPPVLAHSADDTIKVAYFGRSAGDSFDDAIWTGVQTSAEASGFEVDQFLGWDDADKQREQIEETTAANEHDIYVIWAVDGPAIVPAVEEAIANDIAVVAVYDNLGTDALSPSSPVPGVLFIGQSPFDEGYGLARLAIQACDGIVPCKVQYLTVEDTAVDDMARLETFSESLDDFGAEIVRVAPIEGGDTPRSGRQAATTILGGSLIPDVIVGSSQAILGVERALDLTSESIALIGNGSPVEAVTALREGRWHGLFADHPIDAGRLAVELGLDQVVGSEPPTALDLSVIATVQTADQSNIGEDFMGDWQAEG
jgi:ribose transport system substrate-binding protein